MNSINKFLLLTTLYVVTGKLGLLVAVPPGYATPIWPPSAFALVGILIFGYRYWPSIFLGSLLINIEIFANLSNLSNFFHTLTPVIALATSAVLQALLGVYLIRCFMKAPFSLEKEEDILKFVFLGGPASCFVCSFIVIFTLGLIQAIKFDSVFQTWLIFWVGNSVGVLIFAPILMAFIAEPKEIWRFRRWTVALPMLVLFIFTLIIFSFMKNEQNRRIATEFNAESISMINNIKDHFSLYFDTLHTLQNSYKSTTDISRADFNKITKNLLNHKSIIAFEWVPQVNATDKETFERSIQAEGLASFTVKSENFQKLNQPLEVYFPVTYIEPFEKYTNVLGLDLMSNSTIGPALRKAFLSNEVVLTKPFKLFQGSLGSIAFLPVYNNEALTLTDTVKRQQLRGVVALVINSENLIARELESFKSKVKTVEVIDLDSIQGETLIFLSGGSHNVEKNSFHSENTFKIGTRNYLIRMFPNKEYFLMHQDFNIWLILAGGLSFIGFLGVFLLIITGRQTLIKRVVLEKTDDLNKTNEQLKKEIEYSYKVSQDLAKYKEDLLMLSITDPLTGLYNRRGLEMYAQEHLKLAKRDKKSMFLLFIDVDKMKNVNDSFGHKQGDVLLVEVAKLLKGCFRETDIVARLGGDEFSILITLSNPGDENFVIKRLQVHIDKFNEAKPTLPLSLSLGGAICNPEEEFDLEKLIAQADKMMYIQKKSKN